MLLVCGLASALSGCGGSGDAGSGHRHPSLSHQPQLFLVSSDGGRVRQLTRRARWHGSPSWSRDGRRLAYPTGCGLEVIRRDGSRKRALLRRDRRCPSVVSWSPQGDLIAFAALAEDPGPSSVETVKPSGSDHRQIDRFHDERGVDDEEQPAWAPNGERIVYSRFISVPVPRGEVVSPRRAKLVSARADGRGRRQITAGAHFDSSPSWSPNGRGIAFVRVGDRALLRLLVVDARGGAPRLVLDDLVELSNPAWSPSGRQIAFSGVTTSGDRRYYLYVVDLRGRRRRLTGEVTSAPAWSPDGKRIAYADYVGRVRVVAPDGSDERTLTKLPGAEISGLSWSPDGGRLAFTAQKRPPED